ncbi:adenosylmethionine decarboxylase [Chloroflexota bacterium]
MNALGNHVLMELKDCDREVLNNLELLQATMESAAKEAGATVLERAFHQFNPHGVSGVVIVAESHLFIHTWPEYGYAAVDIFTCGDSIRAEKAAELLARTLRSDKLSMIELKRGVLTEALSSSDPGMVSQLTL